MTAQLFMFPEAPELPEAIDGFDQFWRAYPHRVCKGQARRAFAGAIAKATLDQLLDGVRRYVESKPRDIPWCNPATFLNGERWSDEPATNSRTSSADDRELNLIRKRAQMLAQGLTCMGVTARQVAAMLERGWLSKEQACRAGF